MNGLEKTIVPVCTDNDIVASRQRPGVCIGTARAPSPPTFKPGEEESTYPEPLQALARSISIAGVGVLVYSCIVPSPEPPCEQTSIDPSDESTAALDGQQRNA